MPNILNFQAIKIQSIRSINVQKLMIGNNYSFQQSNSYMLIFVIQGQVFLKSKNRHIFNQNELIIVRCDNEFSFTSYIPDTEVLYIIFKTNSHIEFITNRIFDFKNKQLIDQIVNTNKKITIIRLKKPEITYDLEIGQYFTILAAITYNNINLILLELLESDLYNKIPSITTKNLFLNHNLKPQNFLNNQLDYAKKISTDLYQEILVEQVISYLQVNLEKHLRIDDIAQQFLMGSSNLKRIFKKVTGLSIMNYLLKIRMDIAKKLISQHDMTCTEIANKLGYSSVHHLSSAFKKYTGITPTQYYARTK